MQEFDGDLFTKPGAGIAAILRGHQPHLQQRAWRQRVRWWRVAVPSRITEDSDMAEKTVGPAESWRLVHNGEQVLVLMQTGGYTTTTHEIFEAATEQECLSEIDRLHLKSLPPVDVATEL